MVYTLSYQLYKYEHGLSAVEQRAADVAAGEAAAAVRHRRHRLKHRGRPAREATGSGAAPALVRSSVR
jgi:hypothetical protein